jgi:hypothetical protein
MLQRRKEVAFKREKALSQAFSQQVHFLHISLLPCFFFFFFGGGGGGGFLKFSL